MTATIAHHVSYTVYDNLTALLWMQVRGRFHGNASLSHSDRRKDRQWRIQGMNPTMASHLVCEWDFHPPPPQPVKNFAWSDGHWTMCSTYRANIHVELVDLRSSGVFSGAILVKNAFTAGAALLRTPLGSLQRSPDLVD